MPTEIKSLISTATSAFSVWRQPLASTSMQSGDSMHIAALWRSDSTWRQGAGIIRPSSVRIFMPP